MGRYALVEYSLIRQLCQDLKREKNTFSGRLKDFEHDRKASQNDKVEETRRLLLSSEASDKAQSSKRKAEKEKKVKPKRFRDAKCEDERHDTGDSGGSSPSSSESESDGSESSSESTTGESDEDI